MKQNKVKITAENVRKKFEECLQPVCQMALDSATARDFKQRLTYFLSSHVEKPLSPERENLLRLIRNDGMEIFEASTETTLKLETISLLWRYLKGQGCPEEVSAAYLWDIYKQFEVVFLPRPSRPSREQVVRWMRRWPVGTEPRVVAVRHENRQRIMSRLIERIDGHQYGKSRFAFPPGTGHDEKLLMVEQWWNDPRFHLSLAARSLHELNQMMGETLPDEQIAIYQEARRKGIPIFVTPYYLSLMDTTGTTYDDAALRSYVFYSRELVETFGHIKAWEKEDVVEPGKPNAAGWLLPEGHNIHRRYPDVAIMIPDTVGRACGGLCASCQRLYDFQSGRFNFNLESLKPKETWDSKLKRIMSYFREDKQLRDILITGGDALMSQNKSLRKILYAVYLMAKGKREDNLLRPDGEKYAEIQRVRLGTRLPVYLPMRIDDELVSILAEFKTKAQEVGIRQFFVQTHFQTPLEITPEVLEGIRRLHSAGWTVTNQLVYNVAASRRGHTARLRRELNKIGVLCYYTFSVKGFAENHAVFTPNGRSLQEEHEEKVYGRLNDHESRLLVETLNDSQSPTKAIRQLERAYGLPFLATDRNVMNLPGIGKSMTFRLAGILPDGCRVLAFDHDHTRRHSPVIRHMPVVYIKENKSIAEYLLQLRDMGEDCNDYASIWHYTEGRTEPRFSLYEYPAFDYTPTAEYSNIGDQGSSAGYPIFPNAV